MKQNRKKRIGLLMLIIILLVVLVAILLFMGKTSKKNEKIGFIITGRTNETGWNGMHYEGAKAACEELGAELIVKENIKEKEGTCQKAIEELADEGCNMIILTSYGYAEEAESTIQKYPDISFYCNSFNVHADNITSYFSRMYQARYLAGIVAGMKTKTGHIGYVAAMPTSEVNRGINAFTLGVRKANPEAEVIVSWTGEWDNEKKERTLADKLIQDKGVDVLTYHQNQSYVAQEAEKAGIYSIGYHQILKNHSDNYLTTVMGDWKLTYEAVIRQYIRGDSADIKVYWVGMEEKAVKLADLSPLVSNDIKEEIKKATDQMLAGQDVFSDEIYDNKGQLRCKKNQTIRDEILLEHFDWYVRGVKFYGKQK